MCPTMLVRPQLPARERPLGARGFAAHSRVQGEAAADEDTLRVRRHRRPRPHDPVPGTSADTRPRALPSRDTALGSVITLLLLSRMAA